MAGPRAKSLGNSFNGRVRLTLRTFKASRPSGSQFVARKTPVGSAGFVPSVRLDRSQVRDLRMMTGRIAIRRRGSVSRR